MQSITIIISLLVISASAFDYCSLRCRHTACHRPTCAPTSKTCEEISTDMKKFRKVMLDEHNKYRDKIARGEETFGRFPPAAKMNILKYDEDLEFSAKCQANLCQSTGYRCLGTAKFQRVTENIFYLHKTSMVRDLYKVVKFWYVTKNYFNGTAIRQYVPGAYSPFAQIVWDNTTALGCARSFNVKPTSPSEAFTVICHYGHGGLIKGRRVYVSGKTCSRCPDKKCDKKYTGLCEKSGFEPIISFLGENNFDGSDDGSFMEYLEPKEKGNYTESLLERSGRRYRARYRKNCGERVRRGDVLKLFVVVTIFILY